MNKEVERLLAIVFTNEALRRQWLEGHNLVFGRSPKAMIEAGEEAEVIAYLNYHIEGPY